MSSSPIRKVVLWGLPNTGKTSFLLALLKSLRTFGPEMGWSYVLHSNAISIQDDFQSKVLPSFLENFELPPTTATSVSVILELRFMSSVSSGNRLHRVEIVDIPGKDIYDVERLSVIEDSDALICFLSKPDQEQSQVRAINVLQKKVESTDNAAFRKIAVCLSKADQYVDYEWVKRAFKENVTSQDRMNRELLSDNIGPDILNSLEHITEENVKRHFVMSSTGWVKTPTEQAFPNVTAIIGRRSQYIYKPSVWKPWGVMEVFFWLLDGMDLVADIYNINYEQILRLYLAQKYDKLT